MAKGADTEDAENPRPKVPRLRNPVDSLNSSRTSESKSSGRASPTRKHHPITHDNAQTKVRPVNNTDEPDESLFIQTREQTQPFVELGATIDKSFARGRPAKLSKRKFLPHFLVYVFPFVYPWFWLSFRSNLGTIDLIIVLVECLLFFICATPMYILWFTNDLANPTSMSEIYGPVAAYLLMAIVNSVYRSLHSPNKEEILRRKAARERSLGFKEADIVHWIQTYVDPHVTTKPTAFKEGSTATRTVTSYKIANNLISAVLGLAFSSIPVIWRGSRDRPSFGNDKKEGIVIILALVVTGVCSARLMARLMNFILYQRQQYQRFNVFTQLSTGTGGYFCFDQPPRRKPGEVDRGVIGWFEVRTFMQRMDSWRKRGQNMTIGILLVFTCGASIISIVRMFLDVDLKEANYFDVAQAFNLFLIAGFGIPISVLVVYGVLLNLEMADHQFLLLESMYYVSSHERTGTGSGQSLQINDDPTKALNVVMWILRTFDYRLTMLGFPLDPGFAAKVFPLLLSGGVAILYRVYFSDS